MVKRGHLAVPVIGVALAWHVWLEVAAIRTSRRWGCQFLPQRPVSLSPGKLALAFAVEARFISIEF